MTTYYLLSKCKYISFISSPENNEKEITATIDDSHPISQFKPFDDVVLYIDATSKEFEDIQILSDKEHANESSTQLKTQEVLKGPLMGASNNLDAFNEDKYAVQIGKRNAAIIYKGQNHAVLDSMAENGIIIGVKKPNSIKRLFNMLSKINSFSLVIYHPGLETSIIAGHYPDTFLVPKYKIGSGEICAVFYRYICLYFFGYCSIKDEYDYEKNYEL
jgi:hypothetical protein